MKYDLASMAKRQGVQRRSILIRDIAVPAMFATDLYHGAYRDLIASWRASIPAIMDAYERTVAPMTTDTASDIEQEISVAANRAASLVLGISPRINRWVSRVERWQRARWAGAVESATRVDLTTLIGPDDVRETVEAFIARNVALVSDVSAQARGRIADAVFRGLTERKPARDVAREIREAVEMGRKRALRIASDQNSKLATALADERRRSAGIMTWTWVHSEKARPRPEHLERNGKVYSDTPADVGRKIDGKTIGSPPEDRPGALPFCGCRSRSLLLLE